MFIKIAIVGNYAQHWAYPMKRSELSQSDLLYIKTFVC